MWAYRMSDITVVRKAPQQWKRKAGSHEGFWCSLHCRTEGAFPYTLEAKSGKSSYLLTVAPFLPLAVPSRATGTAPSKVSFSSRWRQKGAKEIRCEMIASGLLLPLQDVLSYLCHRWLKRVPVLLHGLNRFLAFQTINNLKQVNI